MKLSSYDEDVDPHDVQNRQKSGEHYSVRGNTFEAVGKTVKQLPPGFYQIKLTFYGVRFVKMDIVTDELIYIPGSQGDVIYGDIEKFLAKRAEYEKAKLTHKRGYILHGPPGTGKTSIAILVGNKFVERGGIVLIPASGNGLVRAIEVMKEMEKERDKLFLLEDITEMDDNDESEFLSVLDGEMSTQNTIMLATTNSIDQLPARLTARPGRFDRVMRIDDIDRRVQLAYARNVLSRLLPDAAKADKLAATVIEKTTKGLPLAFVKEALVAHVLLGEPLDSIHARFRDMIKVSDSDDDDE